MNRAEVNILLRTRATEARKQLLAVENQLRRINKVGMEAGATFDALSKASTGYAANMDKAAASAGRMATAVKSLSRDTAAMSSAVGKMATTLPKATAGMTAFGRATEYAVPQTAAMKISVDRLTASLTAQATAANAAAASMARYGTSATRAGGKANAATAANTAAAAAAAAAAAQLATRSSGGAARRSGPNWMPGAEDIDARARAWARYQYAAERSQAANRALTAGTSQLALGMGQQNERVFRASERLDQMGTATENVTRGQSRFSQAWAGSTAQMSRARAQMGALNDGLYATSTAMRKAGSQMQWTGRQLSAVFTVPTLLAVGFGMKWAMDQERAFTRMAKVYDGAISDIDQNLEQSGIQFSGSKFDEFFTALSEKMGATKTEVAEIGAIWAQVGAQGRNLAEATKLTSEFMVVGDQDAETSARNLISIQAQYKISIQELTEVIWDLNAIENATAVSMKDLADGFARTAAVAREAGVDARHLGAFLAALVPAAGTAAVSANGLKSIFTRLMAPAADAREQLRNLGIEVSDPNWISKNAVERLQVLSERMEGLTQQQKFDLAKPFAGLYQINKFVALMDDLASAQGYYQKALDATADKAKSFQIYQRELNRVLESSPQKFKQVGVILQNALVKIVTPLIPHILYLAQGLAKLMKRFSELSPTTQKWIVLLALALAAVGPLAMLLGSFVILIAVFGKSLAVLNRFLALSAFHLLGLGKATKMVGDETVRRTPLIARAWHVAASAVTASGRAMMTALSAMWPHILNGARALAPRLLSALASMLPRLAAWAGAAAGVLTGPIGWAILALVAIIALFPKQTWAILKGYAEIWMSIFTSVVNIVRGAVAAVIGLFNQLGREGVPLLARPFVMGVRLAGQALKALPAVVAAVFRGVVQVITRAAKAVYDAFSYINPFARHSPSLVENVVGGMAIVKDEFADMADSVSASTKRAYDAIARFGAGTAGLTGRAAGIERDRTREAIRTADPDGTALPAYDQLATELGPLQADLERLNGLIKAQEDYISSLNDEIDRMQDQVDAADKAIEAMNASLDAMRTVSEALSDALADAQEQLEYYSNAPIEGMRAMSDAIFANEMAQKRLQLQIMELEDAGGAVDDLRNKYADLQGEIEKLAGRREELRQAGAGSDILSVYDQMIADLQAQQGATATEGVSEIERAQKELERLQREGERLDLENALKFDPLTRQIEQMTNAAKELPFDTIVAGVRSSKAAVDSLTIAYDASTGAIEMQEGAIKAAESARDALNDQLDTAREHLDAEEEKLSQLQDSHSALEQAISDVESAMEELASAAGTVNSYLEEQARLAEQNKDKLSAAEKAALEAAEAFDAAGMGDFEVPGGENFDLSALMGENANFDDLTKQLSDDVANAFAEIDLTAPIKDFFGRIGNWFTSLPGRVAGWLVGVGVAIASWFAGLPGQVAGWFSGLGSSIAGWFSGLWSSHIWPGLQALPGQLGSFIRGLPNMIIDAIAYMAGFLAGLVLKALIGAFMVGVWLVDKFREGFSWLVENLPTLVMGVVHWFEGLPRWVTNAMSALGQFLVDWMRNGWTWVIENLPGIVSGVIDWFSELPTKIKEALRDLPQTLATAFGEAVQWLLTDLPRLTGDIVGGLYSGLMDAISGVKEWVKSHIIDPFLGGFKDALGIHSPSTVFAEFGKNIIEGLWQGIDGVAGWIVDKVKNFAKEKIVNPVLEVLEINSPSRVFARIGQNLGEGMVVGLDASQSAVAAAAGALAQVSADAAAAPEVAAGVTVPVPSDAELAALSGELTKVDAVYATAYGAIVAETTTATGTMYETIVGATGAYAATTLAQHDALRVGVSGSAAALATTLIGATDTMLTQVQSSWTSATTSVSDSAVLMADSGTTAMQTLADNMSSIMTDQIAPMFSEFDPMLQQVAGWFDSTVDNIGQIWDGIREPVAVPSRFIVNDVYNNGIKVAWNNVAGWIGQPALPDAVAAFERGGWVSRDSLVNPNSPRRVDNGGRLSGSPAGDRTLFAGQGGEFVWSRHGVANIGGVGVLDAMHRAARAGKSLEGAGSIIGLATGGALPGRVIEAQDFARRTFTGQRYDYGATGPNSFDCSGAWSAMYRFLTEQMPYWTRSFTTESNFGALGWDRGLGGAVTIGVHRGGGGPLSHMAGTLGGINLEAGGAHNSSIFGGPAAGSDHPQFEHQYTLREIGGIFSSGGLGGGGAMSMAERVEREFKRVMDPIRDTWPAVAGAIGQLNPQGYRRYYDDVSGHLYGKAREWDAAHPPAGDMAYDGSGVEQWRGLVHKVLTAKGYPLSLDETVLRRMNQESGGNPNAINLWDSNAAAGRPSKGLMQVIDTTFAAYKDAGFDNIWAPEDNLRASMNYAKARYGSIEAGYNRPGGYDQGGWLPPTPGGFSTYYNHTGKPEAVLRNNEWRGVLKLADAASAFGPEVVEEGVVDAMIKLLGPDPVLDAAVATAAAVSEANREWTPLIYDAANAQVDAANATTAAAERTQTGVERFVEVGKGIQATIAGVSELMVALSSAMQNPNSFGAWVPVINAAAKLIETLPEAKPEYVPWAGTTQPVTEEMRRQKAINDAANATKGLYNIGREVLPPLLKHVGIIGQAVEGLLVSAGPIVAAAIAMFPVNPVGAAIMLIPVILQAIFTILPLIISAIMDIVPALIRAIIKFLNQFMPDSVYAYESLEAAEKAAADNVKAIKAGASAPYFVEPAVQNNTTNAPVIVNIYDGVNVVTQDANADRLVANLAALGGG